MRHILTFLLSFITFFTPVLNQAYAMKLSSQRKSSNFTLVPNVNYELNFTLNKTIPTGTTFILLLSK